MAEGPRGGGEVPIGRGAGFLEMAGSLLEEYEGLVGQCLETFEGRWRTWSLSQVRRWAAHPPATKRGFPERLDFSMSKFGLFYFVLITYTIDYLM